MKKEIKGLLEQGHLKEYVKVREPRRERERERVRERMPKHAIDPFQEEMRRVINMIFGRDLSGRDNPIRKRVHIWYIFAVGTSMPLPYQPITFTLKDAERVS